MSPEGPVSTSAEGMNVEDIGRSPSDQAAIPAADITLDDHKEISHSKEAMNQNSSMQCSQDGGDKIDAALLGGVQSSLHTMSTGIDELATTVRDILALDSDGNSSDDYDYDSSGERGQVSWTKLRANARRRRRARRDALERRARINTSDEDSDNEGGIKTYPQTIPEIRECNHDHFHSRQSGDSKVYCVDVLIAGDELDKEVRQFMETADGVKSGKIKNWKPRHISDRTGDPNSRNNEKKWIRRIRINSGIVVDMLHLLTRGKKGRRLGPILFYRPFHLLVSLHNRVKEHLANIKRIISEGATEVINPEIWGSTKGDGWVKFIRRLGDNNHAIDEITCFVDFMEARIMPDARRYRDLSSPPLKTIRFEDLWYLFKPGDLVYVPRDTSGKDNFRSTPFSQQFLRVIQTALGTSMPNPIGQTGNHKPWSLFSHFIEHDGISYAPVHVSMLIPRFEGERKVTELLVYPISYLEDDQLIKQAQADGETYIGLIERRIGFYSGWTQTIDPLGAQVTESSPEGRIISPEHIESEILVDFQETFNAVPSWKPKFYQAMPPDEGHRNNLVLFRPLEDVGLPILEWDTTGGVKQGRFDLHLLFDTTEQLEASDFMNQDPLGQFRKATRKAPTGEYLALLPTRFFGYAVLERKFVQLSTQFVRSAELEANDKAFENLEIDRKYKQLILALVKSHFDKVETEKRRNVEIESQDLIRGKGKGVVILLHGVPGVGKTATAEAVALKWKKPLFPITCGDLGYTAETLEKSLNEIFRLAHHWGCILLLDEADVFITQRERHDLKRNALVSAFLRVLEYYNGIMFLTTNRAGVLDEAIKSRVHLNLYYDHLTEDQTVAIFKQHIQRLRNIEKQRNPDQNEQIMVLHKEILQFARDHFNQGGTIQGPGSNFGRWNGRQIRNAFLIASSLAHYDSEEEGDEDKDELAELGRKKQKQLGRSQFELVAQTTLMYDHYRQSVHSGKSDDHVAFEREERAMSSQPRSPTPVRMKSASMGFN